LVQANLPAITPKPNEALKDDHNGLNINTSILDVAKLNNLESMSQDPAFVDELIAEFISEGNRLIGCFNRSLVRSDYPQIASAMHALRGSALSIGASALKQLCTHIEKLSDEALQENQEDIQSQLNHCFQNLCQALVAYQCCRTSTKLYTI